MIEGADAGNRSIIEPRRLDGGMILERRTGVTRISLALAAEIVACSASVASLMSDRFFLCSLAPRSPGRDRISNELLGSLASGELSAALLLPRGGNSKAQPFVGEVGDGEDDSPECWFGSDRFLLLKSFGTLKGAETDLRFCGLTCKRPAPFPAP